jgi:hypothetical protein
VEARVQFAEAEQVALARRPVKAVIARAKVL